MKAKILVLFFLVLFLSSCKKEGPTSPPINPENEIGALSIQFDKTTIPTNVVLITATLTRTSFDSVHSTMNVLSDSSAELLVPSIAVGTWHLVVRAFGSDNQLLYIGETNINVQANIIVSVSLVLQPTTSNVGSIYIYVRWGSGTQQSSWIDYPGNPLLVATDTSFERYGVAQSKIIFDDNKYRMYYIGVLASGRKNVMYAESVDGRTWTKRTNPVLTTGPNSWDSLAVHPGPIVKENGVYKMYYSGFGTISGKWSIGLAISTDGINWTKSSQPVFSGNSPSSKYVAWSIIKKNDTFYMFYSTMSNPPYSIALATSIDGTNWTTANNSPLLTPTQPWEGVGITCPSVVKDGDIYRMVYMNTPTFGSGTTGFGMAISNDGLSWTRESTSPIFTDTKTANGWAAADIAYPQLIKVGNEWRIYYSGFSNDNAPFYKIGYTRKFN